MVVLSLLASQLISSHPLKACRVRMGLNLADLTARTRLSPYYLSRVEAGERPLPERHARILADVLHVHHLSLMSGINLR